MHTYDKATAFSVLYRAYDTVNQAWIQEDAASLHTLRLLRDGAYSLPIATPQAVTHSSITGLDTHSLAITASEADCDRLELEGESSTEGVIIIPWVGQASRLPSVEPGTEGGVALTTANGVLTAGQQGQLDGIEGGVEAIEAKTALIGTGSITWTAPADSEGNVTVRRARDYNNADGAAIEFVNPDGTWPDLTDATIKLLVARPGKAKADYSFAGSVVTDTGANQTVRVELTASDLNVTATDYVAEVVATLASGRVKTLAEGVFSVLLGRDEPES